MAAALGRAPRNLTWPTLGQLWAFLGVFLPALAALLVPMPAVDLAYQLRAGGDILAGHGVPASDTWTFTVFGTPWLDQQWGAQVILAGSYNLNPWAVQMEEIPMTEIPSEEGVETRNTP